MMCGRFEFATDVDQHEGQSDHQHDGCHRIGNGHIVCLRKWVVYIFLILL